MGRKDFVVDLFEGQKPYGKICIRVYPTTPMVLEVGAHHQHSGSACISLDEARQVVDALQEAIKYVEQNKNYHQPS